MAGLDSERAGPIGGERESLLSQTIAMARASTHGRKFGAELNNDAESQVSFYIRLRRWPKAG